MKAVLLLFLFFGASAQAKSVIVSFSVLESLAREVAPPSVSVTSLVPAGQDAHHYETKASDLVALKKADLVLSVGASFEPWLPRVLRSQKVKAQHVTLTQGMDLRKGGHHGVDPHVWLDVQKSRLLVDKIAQALQQKWPELSKEIETRRSRFSNELLALDQEIRQKLAGLPEDRRTVVVAHQAFGYFAEAYGIRFFSPQNLSTESEPTAKDVARLIRQVREKKAQVVFSESLSDQKILRQIARETGLRWGGVLHSDSLSETAPTYLQMMRLNAETLFEALSSSSTSSSGGEG